MGPSPGAIPLGDILIGPLIGFVGVTAVAGIGHTQFDAQIRPRYPQTVIGAAINDHIEPFRHMALHTLGTGAHFEEHPAVR